jgi:hypothetical protein
MFNYDENYDEGMTAYDAKVEAYGDRCPGCGTLRWGGDCFSCMAHDETEELPLGFFPQPAAEPVAEPIAEFFNGDIEIVF